MEMLLPSASLPASAPAPDASAAQPSPGPDGATHPGTGFDEILRSSTDADGSAEEDGTPEPAAAAVSVLLAGLLQQAPAEQAASGNDTAEAGAAAGPVPELTAEAGSAPQAAPAPVPPSGDADAQAPAAASPEEAGPGASENVAPPDAPIGQNAPQTANSAGQTAATPEEAVHDRGDAAVGKASPPRRDQGGEPGGVPAAAAAGDGVPSESGSAPEVRSGTLSPKAASAAAPGAPGSGHRIADSGAKGADEADGPAVAAHGRGGTPAGGEDGAPAVKDVTKAEPSIDTAERKREEPAGRVAERPEPPAPQNAASDRSPVHGAKEAAAPRQAAAPPAPRFVQAAENAFVLTRKSDTAIEVTLAPPGVGKLEIEVVLEKGVVHANITAADTAGREAIVRSLPHILDALARDGMAVGGFTVSLRDRKGQAGESPARTPPRPADGRPAVSSVVPTLASSSGRVDLFV